MKAIVIYSSTTGRVRRVIVPDHMPRSSADYAKRCVGVGESFHLYDTDDTNDVQELVSKVSGKKPVDDRYLVVKDGKIVAAIYADPLCGDRVNDAQLIPHPIAGPDWSLSNGQFIKPVKNGSKTGIIQKVASFIGNLF